MLQHPKYDNKLEIRFLDQVPEITMSADQVCIAVAIDTFELSPRLDSLDKRYK